MNAGPAAPNETGVVLSLAAVRVSDLRGSTDFYARGLGFVVEREFATPAFDAVILRAGTAGIELIRPKGAAGEENPDHGNMFDKLVLNVADAAATLRRGVDCGGTEVSPVVEHASYGMAIGVLADPDGHRLELVSRNGSL
ncbi:VOC family protein [Gordonia metallireducens]|uniref:VOC family protein n=1 Tax=Gordonia metallireducens TaxID=2897779 RepID=UPI001E4D8826|nr:VOC family protein [Gordonia metallireducens]